VLYFIYNVVYQQHITNYGDTMQNICLACNSRFFYRQGDEDCTAGVCSTCMSLDPNKMGGRWARLRFRILQREYDIFIYANYGNFRFGYDMNQAFIETIIDKLPESIIDALQSINNACTNYGDYYRFEFCKRNLKVNKDGTLILLDCIFNSHALKSFQKNT